VVFPVGLQRRLTAGTSAQARQIGQGPFDDSSRDPIRRTTRATRRAARHLAGEVIASIPRSRRRQPASASPFPSNMAKRIYGELLAKGQGDARAGSASRSNRHGRSSRGRSPKDSRGVLVSDVMRDSPAAKGGAPDRRHLARVRRQEARGAGRLQRGGRPGAAGTTARTGSGATRREDARPQDGDAPDEREVARGSRGRSLLGLDVRPITPDVARQLNLRSTRAWSSPALRTAAPLRCRRPARRRHPRGQP